MTSLAGKIALVTGASAGFGEATALALARCGARLIIAARREDRLEGLATRLSAEHGRQVCLSLPLDVRDRVAVERAMAQVIADGWGAIDILVNNAGLAAGLEAIQDGLFANWDRMIDTNLNGVLNVSRFVLPGMVARRGGHVVNIGSIAARDPYAGGNVYGATKAAIAQLSRNMRVDLLPHRVRVTHIAPGLAETEFSLVRFAGDREKAQSPYRGLEPLVAADIADAVVWAVSRPAHVNIDEIVLMPLAQASANHIQRD